MDETTARRLIALNNEFYRRAAGSFSATRHASWPGWEQVVDSLLHDLPGKCMRCEDLPRCDHVMGKAAPLRVLDLACGNLRFEAYMEHACPTLPFHFHAVDNCSEFER
ncbi:MAG: hypothetical protein J5804_01345, partial [Eggerthellaceae bacterium]|nr:hypothetical protein [Eggerthellaceae bacterium]